MHEIIGFGLTLAAILAGILFSRNDTRELRQELNDLRREIHTEFGAVHADLRQFYHLTGKLEGRIDALEKRA